MDILRIEDYTEIFMNEEISEILGSSMFNPSYGKIQNVAQSIYAKTQGRFYIGKINNLIVGVLGLSKINNDKLVVKHIAVSSSFQRQKIATEMLNYIIINEGVDIVEAETDDDAVSFYKGFGFIAKKLPDDGVKGQRYLCTYTVKK